MEFWKIAWFIALIAGSAAFVLISWKVIWRGFSEMRDLLRNLDK